MIKFILIGSFLINPNFISALENREVPFSAEKKCIVYVSGSQQSDTKYGSALSISINGTCQDFIKKLNDQIKDEEKLDNILKALNQ